MEQGRPRKYKTVDEMQQAIDKYFLDCDNEGIPYTITGLSLALGFDSRVSLLNYEGYTDEDNISFLSTIKKAKQKVEKNIEEGALQGKYNPTISIFNLKNNFDWRDKQEVENTGSQTLEINIKVIE